MSNFASNSTRFFSTIASIFDSIQEGSTRPEITISAQPEALTSA